MDRDKDRTRLNRMIAERGAGPNTPGRRPRAEDDDEGEDTIEDSEKAQKAQPPKGSIFDNVVVRAPEIQPVKTLDESAETVEESPADDETEEFVDDETVEEGVSDAQREEAAPAEPKEREKRDKPMEPPTPEVAVVGKATLAASVKEVVSDLAEPGVPTQWRVPWSVTDKKK